MTPALDTAASLVAIAARGTFDARQREDLHAIIDAGVDWPRVLALAEKNYVIPLLFESLDADFVRSVPQGVWQRLAAQRKFLKFRAELFCDELERLSGVLDASGIPALHYKGPVCSQMLYGNRYRRTYFDLDFLVRRQDLDAVSRLLLDQGYRCNLDLDRDERDHFEREQKEYAFVSGMICVEPHFSITARRYPFPVDYEAIWARATTYDFSGTPLRTFAPRDMLLILSVVGAKGKWKRLQMVTDVALCYGSLDAPSAALSLEDARELGCERILLVGAHLAGTLLGAPISAAISARIDADRPDVEKVTRQVIDELFREKLRTKLVGASAHLYSPLLLHMRERRRDRLTYLLRSTTTPTTVHFTRFPLPRWAYPAYRLIVPIHDYVLVPIVHALRSLRRA
jgi:hypothetical protein